MATVRVTLFRAVPGQAERLAAQLAITVREVRAAIVDMISITTGPKTGGNAEYDCAIVAVYPNQAALYAYDVHPAHLDTKSRMDGFVAEIDAIRRSIGMPPMSPEQHGRLERTVRRLFALTYERAPASARLQTPIRRAWRRAFLGGWAREVTCPRPPAKLDVRVSPHPAPQ